MVNRVEGDKLPAIVELPWIEEFAKRYLVA